MKAVLASLLTVALAAPAYAQSERPPLSEAASREVRRLVAAEAQSAPPTTQPRPAQPSWIARHPALTGALIGLGAGFAIGSATCAGLDNDNTPGCHAGSTAESHMLGGLKGGAIGASIGAIVGAIAGMSRQP
jgi:hypothetical protein